MKLKRLGTLLLTAIIAATTLAGCGAVSYTHLTLPTNREV